MRAAAAADVCRVDGSSPPAAAFCSRQLPAFASDASCRRGLRVSAARMQGLPVCVMWKNMYIEKHILHIISIY